MPTELNPSLEQSNGIQSLLSLDDKIRFYLYQEFKDLFMSINCPYETGFAGDISSSFPSNMKSCFCSNAIISTKMSFEPLHQELIGVVDCKPSIKRTLTVLRGFDSIRSMSNLTMKRTLAIKETSKVNAFGFHKISLQVFVGTDIKGVW